MTALAGEKRKLKHILSAIYTIRNQIDAIDENITRLAKEINMNVSLGAPIILDS